MNITAPALILRRARDGFCAAAAAAAHRGGFGGPRGAWKLLAGCAVACVPCPARRAHPCGVPPSSGIPWCCMVRFLPSEVPRGTSPAPAAVCLRPPGAYGTPRPTRPPTGRMRPVADAHRSSGVVALREAETAHPAGASRRWHPGTSGGLNSTPRPPERPGPAQGGQLTCQTLEFG